MSTNVKFVSRKISRVRWQPTTKQVVKRSEVFAAGSWDEPNSAVQVWQVKQPTDDPAESSLMAPPGEPVFMAECPHKGDVTDLQFMTEELVLASSSSGFLTLYRYYPQCQTFSQSRTWNNLHHYPRGSAPCTAIATQGETLVATVGEDGRLNVIDVNHKKPQRTVEKADSCSLNGVTFLKQQEVATVNSTGQLKVWDLRQPQDKPTNTYLLTAERVPLHCVDKHPTQPHIVATGGQDGMLCMWDMRQDKFPVTLLDAHNANMWEVKFHPSHPDNLFTCSEDGEVWHWDGTSVGSTGMPTRGTMSTSGIPLHRTSESQGTPWLISDAAKHRLDVTNLLPGNTLPVNSLDIQDNTLVCSTDGEAIYVVHNLVIR